MWFVIWALALALIMAAPLLAAGAPAPAYAGNVGLPAALALALIPVILVGNALGIGLSLILMASLALLAAAAQWIGFSTGRAFSLPLDLWLLPQHRAALTAHLTANLPLTGLLAFGALVLLAAGWALAQGMADWAKRLGRGPLLVLFLLLGIGGALPSALRDPVQQLVQREAQALEQSLVYEDQWRAYFLSDPAPAIPGERRLSALNGAPVIWLALDGYAREAIDDPRLGGAVGQRLDNLGSELGAQGIAAFSASVKLGPEADPRFAALSLLTGRAVAGPAAFAAAALVQAPTLAADFAAKGYQTLYADPRKAHPALDDGLMGFGTVRTREDLAFDGPAGHYPAPPDQWLIGRLLPQATGTPPQFSLIRLSSALSPWTPLAPVIAEFAQAADGRIYGQLPSDGLPADRVLSDPNEARSHYVRAIDRALEITGLLAKTLAGRPFVIILSGGALPAGLLPGASGQMPVHIIASGPDLLAGCAAAGFAAGLRPAPGPAALAVTDLRQRLITCFS